MSIQRSSGNSVVPAEPTGGADVIVCGGGLAGMAAAIRAVEAGATVLLVEKAPRLGGTTLLSSGTIWTWCEFDELEAAIPQGHPILQQLVVDTIDDGRAWLAGHGVDLGSERVVQDHGCGRSMAPTQAISALSDRLTELGGRILTSTSLDALLVENGSVVGIRAFQGETPVTFAAESVVLATGGFQGNPELLTRFVVDNADDLYLRANPWSTGDGFIAATSIGAAVTPGLDAFYGHAMIAPPANFTQDHFGEVSQYYGKCAVALNLDGVRFADETAGTGEEVLNQRLARERQGRGFYVVDAAIAAMAYTGERVNQVILSRAERYKAPMVVADTLEELARGLGDHGLPRATVLATLHDFNAAILDSKADDLVPPRKLRRTPLVEPPFCAVGVKASITATTGGIATDERMRVLRRTASSSPIAQSITRDDEYQGTPITGLYAAGCDAGNFSHVGYMGMLGVALTTGRIAGEEAGRRTDGARATA